MEVFFNSLSLILSFDKDLYEIIFLSLRVSLLALLISTIIGLPIAGILASKNFLGKKLVLIFFNSMMALPPVFVGLVLYVLFSQSGFFGFMNILYTPMIMVIAQVIIILPIIISVSAELLEQSSALNLGQQLGCPVMVLTARAGVETIVGLLDDGADDVLRKPFGLEELAARCRTLLKRGRIGLQERVTVGPLEVHLLLRQVMTVELFV